MKWLNSNKKGDADDDNLEFDYESWKITSRGKSYYKIPL